MTELVWDKVGDRVYETGLDKGVLYLPDGSAVPWNGLTSVIEKFDKSTSPVYYDGMKINELVSLGSFSATMKAVTYPDEFEELEGVQELRPGFMVGDQRPKVFGLCYRTRVGNDLEGDDAGYKIHIIYNLTAIPSDRAYVSASDDPSLVDFEWSITAIPEEVPGFRPTAHYVVDSRKFDPWLVEELEDILYGNTSADAVLLPMSELISYIRDWYRIKITDHEDGTWSATSVRPELIQNLGEDTFQILQANAVYLDDDTYEISDTLNFSDVPQIAIIDNGDGTWTASTSHDNLIVMIDEDSFEIRNAEAIFLDEDTFVLSDTPA